METSLEIVDFLGGPLDGYQRTMTPDMLAGLVEFDVSENTFRIMAKKREKRMVSATSTAIYQLARAHGPARYHFIASVPLHKEEGSQPTLSHIIRSALRRVIGR